jgi:hypothetical protein
MKLVTVRFGKGEQLWVTTLSVSLLPLLEGGRGSQRTERGEPF